MTTTARFVEGPCGLCRRAIRVAWNYAAPPPDHDRWPWPLHARTCERCATGVRDQERMRALGFEELIQRHLPCAVSAGVATLDEKTVGTFSNDGHVRYWAARWAGLVSKALAGQSDADVARAFRRLVARPHLAARIEAATPAPMPVIDATEVMSLLGNLPPPDDWRDDVSGASVPPRVINAFTHANDKDVASAGVYTFEPGAPAPGTTIPLWVRAKRVGGVHPGPMDLARYEDEFKLPSHAGAREGRPAIGLPDLFTADENAELRLGGEVYAFVHALGVERTLIGTARRVDDEDEERPIRIERHVGIAAGDAGSAASTLKAMHIRVVWPGPADPGTRVPLGAK